MNTKNNTLFYFFKNTKTNFICVNFNLKKCIYYLYLKEIFRKNEYLGVNMNKIIWNFKIMIEETFYFS